MQSKNIDLEKLRLNTAAHQVRLQDFLVILTALPFALLLLLTFKGVEKLLAVRPGGRRGKGRQDEQTGPLPDWSLPPAREAEYARRAPEGADPFRQRLNGLLNDALSALINNERLNAILELRNRHYMALDLLALSLIPAVALTLRSEGLGWWPEALPGLALYTAVSLLVKICLFYYTGLYGRYWPYASVSDVVHLMVGVGYSTLILASLFVFFHAPLLRLNLAIFRSVPLIEGMMTALVAGGIRFSIRGLYDWYRRYRTRRGGRNVLIVGAGEAGMMTVREIWANPKLALEPVAFVDDDPAKVGTHVYGIPVLGDSQDIPEIVDTCRIQRILLAIPSAPLPRLQELASICRSTGILTDTLPGVYQILAGHKAISPLPQVDIHRILRREPVSIDVTALAPILRGARVMVTGAGGSIGSELCRQVAALRPAELILLGHGENSIFEIGLDLSIRHPDLVLRQVIADVRESGQVCAAMSRYRPHIIFHAAAHKHVPFMEQSAAEAITNNVLGTRNVLRAAAEHHVRRFVLISTDKAINPSSVMGVTKRIAELLTLAEAQRRGSLYTVVRFGNVLGSRGSVIPTFQRQIAAGGPVTVTNPAMYRFFMTIPEAVQLVLQAAVLSKGRDIFVLDMGEPVRILDLAEDLIRLSGLEPGRDINIVFSGARPGEKLREELFFPGEGYRRSRHGKIFVSDNQPPLDLERLEAQVERLILAASELKTGALTELIRAIVPEYQPFVFDGEPTRPRAARLGAVQRPAGSTAG